MGVKILRDQEIDAESVLAASPLAALPQARANLLMFMNHSVEMWVGYHDREVACVCGLIPPSILSDRAYLWMLHTYTVEQHKFLFIRHSQMWIKEILERYPIIYGHVEKKNHQAIRWLKWLGAEMKQSEQALIPFEIRRG